MRGGGGTGPPRSVCPRAQLPALRPRPVPPFPGPGLAGPSASPGSSGHMRWETGGQVTTWPEAQVVSPSWLEPGAEPSAQGFRGSSSHSPVCLEGGLGPGTPHPPAPTFFAGTLLDQSRAGILRWPLPTSGVHRAPGAQHSGPGPSSSLRAWPLGLYRKPLPGCLLGMLPASRHQGSRLTALITSLSSLFEVGRPGESSKNAGLLFNFTRNTMV